MCLVQLECVCLFCKFGAFSEILGIKISKFSRGNMPPDPPKNRLRKGSSLGQIDSNTASVEILSWLRVCMHTYNIDESHPDGEGRQSDTERNTDRQTLREKQTDTYTHTISTSLTLLGQVVIQRPRGKQTDTERKTDRQ